VVKPDDDSKDNIGHEQEWKECEGVYVPGSLEVLLEVLKTEHFVCAIKHRHSLTHSSGNIQLKSFHVNLWQTFLFGNPLDPFTLFS